MGQPVWAGLFLLEIFVKRKAIVAFREGLCYNEENKILGGENMTKTMSIAEKLEKILKDSGLIAEGVFFKIAICDAIPRDALGNYIINIGYERVSTDSQIDGYGLDTQEDALMAYAKSQGFKNFVIFEDQGETGTKMNRPAINAIKRMITAYNVGGSKIKVASFTIPKIDRLSRTSLGTLQFIQDYIVPQKDAKDSKINRNKEIIEFHSCNESFVSVKKDDSTGNMMLQIFAALAEYDRNEIVKKLSTGKQKRMEAKKWPGGSPPFGFTYNYKTGKLEIKEDEAEIVRTIYKLYIFKKMPPEKIAQHYVPTLGPKFTEKRVRDILTREMYAGVLTYGDFRAEEAYESIISPETFARAQMEKRSRSTHRGRSNYLLSGLVECGCCGGKMRYQNWGSGRKKLVCYATIPSAPDKVKHTDKCNQIRPWADEVEAEVVRALLDIKMPDSDTIDAETMALASVGPVQEKLVYHQQMLRGYYEQDTKNKVNGIDDGGILQELIDSTIKEIAKLTAELGQEKDREINAYKAKEVMETVHHLGETWDTFTTEEKQRVFKDIIEKVVLIPDGAASMSIDVKLQQQALIDMVK